MGDIHRVREGFAPGPSDLVADLVREWLAPTRRHRLRAPAGQPDGEGPPQTRGPAHDNRNAPRQIHQVLSHGVWSREPVTDGCSWAAARPWGRPNGYSESSASSRAGAGPGRRGTTRA